MPLTIHKSGGAVSALKHCGDASVPGLIRPLAAGQGGPDPNDDIKGNALDLLWPDHLTAAELFPLLTPTADNYFGAYALFQMTLPDTLKTADLLPALEWATQLIAQSGHMGGFRAKSLADAIMFKVWQAFENPELTQPFLDHIAVRLRHHGDLCRGTDHDEQKAFLSAIRDDVRAAAISAGSLRRLSTGSKLTPTGAWACFWKLTWSGFSRSHPAVRPRNRASTPRPSAILSSAHLSSAMPLTSRRFTPPPSAGRTCARDTPSVAAFDLPRSRRPERSRSNCARWRTTAPRRSRPIQPAKF